MLRWQRAAARSTTFKNYIKEENEVYFNKIHQNLFYLFNQNKLFKKL